VPDARSNPRTEALECALREETARANDHQDHERDVGGFFKVDNRLYVGGRDRTKVIDGLGWQVRAVTKALAGLDVTVSSAVCFTDAEWGWFAKPFTIREVFVSGPNALARKISETSALSVERIKEIAVHLSGALPAKE